MKIAVRASALSLILAPVVGLFCWHWEESPAAVPPAGSDWQTSTGVSLLPPLELRQEPGLRTDLLQPLPNPIYRDNRRVLDPFFPDLNREMVAAQGDPFLFALLSGNTEGRLIPRSQAQGVVTFGLPSLSGMTDSAAKRELLRSMNSGLGGPLRKFMADVFDPPEEDLLELVGNDHPAEENPFSRAIESLREGRGAETVSTADAKEKTAGKDSSPPQPPAKTDATTKVQVGSGGSVTTVRPYVMLKLESNGEFRALPVSQPREGVYESAEFGLADFKVFPFTDVAEFPMSMAAADFDRDSRPDLALHVPNQGLLRFFFSDDAGDFTEGMRVQVSRWPSSVAVGDFNGDGWADLAVSSLGTGTLTLLYGDATTPYRQFRVFWLDLYRDYITVAARTDSGTSEILGMNFANQASVLLEIGRSQEKVSGKKVASPHAHESEVSSPARGPARLNAVATGSSLSVNFENRMRQMLNVANVQAGTNLFVLVGDLDNNGSIDLGLALPIR